MKYFMKKMAASIIACFLFTNVALAHQGTITIGAKTYSEQYILAEIAKILLENEGFDVNVKSNLVTAIIRTAIKSGEIDLHFSYTGTAYTVFHKQKDVEIMTDPQKIYEYVKKADVPNGIIWLDMIPFNNTNALMIRKEDQEKYNLFSITDLSAFLNDNPEYRFAISAEFSARKDGYRYLSRKYKFPRNVNLIKMDFGLIYKALKDKQVDVGLSYSTDGRISAWGFVNLEDDLNHFPVYFPAACVREEVLQKYPEIEEILKPMSEKLTVDDMRRMNAAVDIEDRPVSEVAQEWVDQFVK